MSFFVGEGVCLNLPFPEPCSLIPYLAVLICLRKLCLIGVFSVRVQAFSCRIDRCAFWLTCHSKLFPAWLGETKQKKTPLRTKRLPGRLGDCFLRTLAVPVCGVHSSEQLQQKKCPNKKDFLCNPCSGAWASSFHGSVATKGRLFKYDGSPNAGVVGRLLAVEEMIPPTHRHASTNPTGKTSNSSW